MAKGGCLIMKDSLDSVGSTIVTIKSIDTYQIARHSGADCGTVEISRDYVDPV